MIHPEEPRQNARPKIGELLWRRGACDRDALVRAWELKVIYGDRLGTNLLAEALVEEKGLALALGEQHGVHAAYGELLRVDPRAVALLKGPVADRHNVVPHHVENGALYLLMTDPHNVQTTDLVHKGTGLNVVPVVVCEARMWALLLEHYGISRGMRPIALDGDPFLAAQRRLKAHEEKKQQAVQGPELTSEEDFQALYMSRAMGDEARPEPTAPVDVTPVVAGQPLSVDDGELIQGVVLEELPVAAPAADIPLEQPPPVPLAPPPEVRRPASPTAESPTPGSLWAEATTVEATTVEATPVEAIAVEAPEPELTPLSFEEATALLKGVHDRDEIARVVLRYALTRFRRAALLTVHPHGVFGWEALGDLPRDAVRAFRLPKSERSVFGVVVDNRAHYIGTLQTWTANGTWVKTLGRQLPRSVAIFPILVRGRVVNLLYGDNGHGEHVESDVGELLILAQRIADSYEALLQSAAAFSPS